MALESCRICGGNEDLKSILNDGPEIFDKLLKCANIVIHSDDLLPKLLCATCDQTLEVSYRLRRQSEATQQRLKLELEKKQLEEKIQELIEKEKQFQNITTPDNFKDEKNIRHAVNKQDAGDDDDDDIQFVEDCDTKVVAEAEISEPVFYDDAVDAAQQELFQNYNEGDDEISFVDPKENVMKDEANGEVIIAAKTVYIKCDQSKTEENNALVPTATDVHETQDFHDSQHQSKLFTNELVNGSNVQQSDQHILIDDDDYDDNDEATGYGDEINYDNEITNENNDTVYNQEQLSIELLSSDTTLSVDGEQHQLQQHNYEEDADDLNDPSSYSCYSCATCNQIFSQQSALFEHIKEHGSERYQCIQCLKFFPSRSRLKRHEQVHYKQKGTLTCPHCSQIYRDKSNLKRHIKSAHEDQKSFICTHCSQAFSRIDVWQKHVKRHKDEMNTFTCEICDFSFQSKVSLKKHKWCHMRDGSAQQKQNPDDTTFVCIYCYKISKSYKSHQNHLLLHTTEPTHNCDLCQKKFVFRKDLVKHQREFHMDIRPYQCTHCLKRFRQPCHLKNHLLIHTGERPYVCTICQKTFQRKHALTVHIRGDHLGDKPYKCADCPSAYKQLSFLRRHARVAHGKKCYKEYNGLDDTTTTDDAASESHSDRDEVPHYEADNNNLHSTFETSSNTQPTRHINDEDDHDEQQSNGLTYVTNELDYDIEANIESYVVESSTSNVIRTSSAFIKAPLIEDSVIEEDIEVTEEEQVELIIKEETTNILSGYKKIETI